MNVKLPDAWEAKPRYIYVGPGEGKGELHHLLSSSPEEIITWGERLFTWIGTPALFREHFQPAP